MTDHTAPLRVAVVARATMPLHGIGGLERSVRDLVRHLARLNVAVTLITPPPSVARRVTADPFASPNIRVRHVSYLTFPLANRRGTTILDRSTAYLLFGVRAGRLARRLARAGEADIVHGFGASVLGYTLGRGGSPAPLVLNPQGLEEFGATGPGLPWGKRAGYSPLRSAVRRCARAADAIIATDASLEPAVTRHLRLGRDRLWTIPNGIDLMEAAAFAGPAEGAIIRQRHGISTGETVLLSVGRLEENKGLDVMAAALARAARPGSPLSATGWRWVIVGAGPFRRTIEQAVETHGLGTHVLFAGRAPDEDLHAWYEAASVFVHPTRYEGSSLVTLEAMAHRRPVIATRAGGLPDKVRPGKNGWLVEPDDAIGLGQAIVDATSTPGQLAAMGAHGRAIVEAEFAWPVIAERHLLMYQELRQAKGQRP
jgi:glycosyltransferase involved in cell wall biosynthesis